MQSAVQVIHAHAGKINLGSRRGFLRCLRPYSGLHIETFSDVVSAILTICADPPSPRLDLDVAHSLWSICHTSRQWATRPNSMLRINGLISDNELRLLSNWIDVIEASSLALLAGHGMVAVVKPYVHHIVGGHPFVPTTELITAIECMLFSDIADERLNAALAAKECGEDGMPLLESLNTLAQDFSEPDVNQAVTDAIQAIVRRI